MEKYKIGDVVRLVDAREGSRNGPLGENLNTLYKKFIGKELEVCGFFPGGLEFKNKLECFSWRVEPVDISLENE